MTRVGDPIPSPVFVPVAGGRHIVYAASQAEVEAIGHDAAYATTLCGLPCGADPVRRRREARGLPDCAVCRAEDTRRWPNAASRRMMR